jgi:hypothetical protein
MEMGQVLGEVMQAVKDDVILCVCGVEGLDCLGVSHGMACNTDMWWGL